MLNYFSLIFNLFELSCIYVRVAAAAAEIELVRERALEWVRNHAVNMLERHLRDSLGPIKRDNVAAHVGDAMGQARSIPGKYSEASNESPRRIRELRSSTLAVKSLGS